MAYLRFKGFRTGTPIDLSVSDGNGTISTSVPAFRAPAAISGLPRISSTQAEGDTLTLDITGLTGISAYDWRVVGGATLGTSATLNSADQAGRWIECAVTCDQGILVSPAVHVYMQMPMASHNSDDAAVLALCPHVEATHMAVADGDWSDPTTWLDGRIPANGARVLIPHGRTIRNDFNDSAIRLDWVRNDGRVDVARNVSTNMLVETYICTRGSVFTAGLDANTRMQEGVKARMRFSGRHYRDNAFLATDLNLTRDPKLWGRGFISQGEVHIWGAERFHGCLATGPVMAGDTSLTLENDPVGWQVGDIIVLSGLEIGLQNNGEPWRDEDEQRVISAISGRTISWVNPLDYDHNDKEGLRGDIRPAVQLLRGRNVIFESEVTDMFWRRGHFAMLHGLSKTDIWGAQFYEMGRTNKSVPAGIIDGNGDFLTHNAASVNSVRVVEPLTAQSNLQGRYPFHFHHAGFNHAARGQPTPTFNENYIEGSPGWGVAHHACEAHMFRNSIRRCWSGGMTAEAGNETGVWSNNISSHMTAFGLNGPGNMVNTPKSFSENGDRLGDPFRYGEAFAFRSRALVVTDNIAFNCTSACTFVHRTHGEAFVSPIDHMRENIGLKSIGHAQHSIIKQNGEMNYSQYPILHFTNNLMIGCWFGFFVTKEVAPQTHDASIKLRNNTVWGCLGRGCWIEYVVTYVVDNWDIAMAGDFVGGWGHGPYQASTNAFQIIYRNCRAQGSTVGNNLRVSGGTGAGGSIDRDVYDPDNRRYYAIGNDFENAIWYSESGTQTKTEVLYESDDWDNGELDYDLDPAHTYPLIVGTWNGSSNTGGMANQVTNSDGAKTSNFTTAGKLAEKPFRDGIFSGSNAEARHFCRDVGYYEYDGGYILFSREIISDDLTGRPALFPFFYTCSNEPNVGTNNGPIDHVTTPISATDKLATVAAGDSIVIDVVSDATGGNGTIILENADVYGADRGELSLDTVNGTITYTPHYYVTESQDEFYIFLRSGDTMFKTVRVNILIGSATAPETPVENTNFTASSGSGASEIDVTLLERPDAGGRTIRLVQYSTDNGASWRRLTNLWPQTTLTVTHESNGAPLSAGNYTLRLRYHHEHEYAYSAPSAPMVVAVG